MAPLLSPDPRHVLPTVGTRSACAIPVPSIAATTAPVTVVIAIVTRCFIDCDNRVYSATVDLLGKPNLVTIAPNSAVVGDAVANQDAAGPVRSRPQCDASYRRGAVESPRWWEMYFSQSLTSAQDLLHQAGRLDRLPTARRRRSLQMARDRDAEQRDDIAMFTSSCSPPRPRVCLAAADDAAQRHRCKRQQRCHVPVSSRATCFTIHSPRDDAVRRRIGQHVRAIVVIPRLLSRYLISVKPSARARRRSLLRFRLRGGSSFSVRRDRSQAMP